MKRVFLIDTDAASDDAIALIMALRAPDIRVAAITTVAGSVGVEQATRNALYTTDVCGADVPVYMGAEKPLLRSHVDATWFHGSNGLGGYEYPPPGRSAERGDAVDAIINVSEANPGLILVTLGPLTNVALALARKPSIARNISRCVLMAGAPCCEGNVTPAAEYNVWVDPEAARIVLRGGLPAELIGWQLSRGDAILDSHDITHVSDLNTERARFALECSRQTRQALLEQSGEIGIALPDPVAMSIALDASVGVRWGHHYVDVETNSELTRGMTVVDRRNVAGDALNRPTWDPILSSGVQTKVCWSINATKWKEALYSALS